jgi:hypothetical protein
LLWGKCPQEFFNKFLGKFGDSLEYTIDDSGFTWMGKSDLTASDLLAPDGDAESRSDTASAVDFLRGELENGPRLQKELVKAGEFTERTLQRAAKKVGVKREREGERGAWLWRLSGA